MNSSDTGTPPSAVVTVAALYGTGGRVIGPRVAERLGVTFLDRAIPASVAKRAGVPVEAVASADEHSQQPVDRLISSLARVVNSGAATGQPVERIELDERKMRSEIEAFLAHASRSGGVVLGRGGAVVLRDVPGALHVHLGGSRDARVEAIIERDGVDRDTAERLVDSNDRARMDYVQYAYGVDGEDPSLYHVMIDALALGVDGCIELIVAASHLRMAHA